MMKTKNCRQCQESKTIDKFPAVKVWTCHDCLEMNNEQIKQLEHHMFGPAEIESSDRIMHMLHSSCSKRKCIIETQKCDRVMRCSYVDRCRWLELKTFQRYKCKCGIEVNRGFLDRELSRHRSSKFHDAFLEGRTQGRIPTWRMDEAIKCPCGSTILKQNFKCHQQSGKHIRYELSVKPLKICGLCRCKQANMSK